MLRSNHDVTESWYQRHATHATLSRGTKHSDAVTSEYHGVITRRGSDETRCIRMMSYPRCILGLLGRNFKRLRQQVIDIA